MSTNQVIQTSIDELRAITRVDLCVMDIDGRVAATTFESNDMEANLVTDFAESMADSQVINGYHFFKIVEVLDQERIVEPQLIPQLLFGLLRGRLTQHHTDRIAGRKV